MASRVERRIELEHGLLDIWTRESAFLKYPTIQPGYPVYSVGSELIAVRTQHYVDGAVHVSMYEGEINQDVKSRLTPLGCFRLNASEGKIMIGDWANSLFDVVDVEPVEHDVEIFVDEPLRAAEVAVGFGVHLTGIST